jgi:putative ABC transport system permease protein
MFRCLCNFFLPAGQFFCYFCVLSTGVILLLTCGFSLMMLIGKNIDDRYPTDIIVTETVSEAGKGMDDFAAMNKALQQDGIVTTDQIYRQYRNIMVTEKDGKQKITDPDTFDSDIASDIVTYLLSAADYNEYANTDLKLKDDEILIYGSGKEWKKGDTLNFMGKEYTVAGEADYSAIRYIIDSTMSIFEREILVFPDDEQICALMAEAGQRVNPDEYEVFIGYQLEKALTAEQMETVRALVELGGLNHEAICFKSEEMSVFYTLYGGIFFVGMFLAALFLMATVMIIYYKQMSEGYEDQKRFQILSNVGLTEKEAKESIRTQVMLLFYLPVAAAIMHMIVASSVVRLFLRMILIVDTFTFNMAIAIVSMIFLVIYTIVYKITSREYYNIVNRKD